MHANLMSTVGSANIHFLMLNEAITITLDSMVSAKIFLLLQTMTKIFKKKCIRGLVIEAFEDKCYPLINICYIRNLDSRL